MIRTSSVKLTTIPATAYRTKTRSSGVGIVIVRKDRSQPGIASISKSTGEPILSHNTPVKDYPKEAFAEALELTAGLPFGKKALAPELKSAEHVEEFNTEYDVIIDSEDYQKIVEKYTDKKGVLSYALLNKDLIKFVNSSSVARQMIADKAPLEAIRTYAAGSKFRSITGDHDMTDDQVLKMAELLDDVSPKGIFKEFNNELRKKLKK